MAYIGQKPTDKPLSASDLEDGLITNSKLAQDIISGETELAEAPADTDEFLISDAGVLKRLDASFIGGGGKVLQVVQAINSGSSVSTSSGTSSFVDTGLTANITPSATTSKVLAIITHPQARKINSDTQLLIKLLRDSTDIYVGIGSFDTQDGGRITDTLTFAKVDSPSTTSQITYKTQFASGNGVIYNGSGSPSTIILMEIGA